MKWIESIDRFPSKRGAYYCFDKRYNQKKLLWYNPKAGNSIITKRPKDILWLDEGMTITEQEIWNEACKAMLRSISKTFLDPTNQDKADKESDKHVLQAVGETIINFPLPTYTSIY